MDATVFRHQGLHYAVYAPGRLPAVVTACKGRGCARIAILPAVEVLGGDLGPEELETALGWVRANRDACLAGWMSGLGVTEPEPGLVRAAEVSFDRTRRALMLALEGARVLLPVGRDPELAGADEAALLEVVAIAGGELLYWPKLERYRRVRDLVAAGCGLAPWRVDVIGEAKATVPAAPVAPKEEAPTVQEQAPGKPEAPIPAAMPAAVEAAAPAEAAARTEAAAPAEAAARTEAAASAEAAARTEVAASAEAATRTEAAAPAQVAATAPAEASAQVTAAAAEAPAQGAGAQAAPAPGAKVEAPAKAEAPANGTSANGAPAKGEEPKVVKSLLGLILYRENILSQPQLQRIGQEQIRLQREENKQVGFGQVAIELGLISQQQLQFGIHLQNSLAHAADGSKPLGVSLIESSVVMPSQLLEALEEQKKTGERLGEVLVRFGFISRENLATFLERQKGEAPVAKTPPPTRPGGAATATAEPSAKMTLVGTGMKSLLGIILERENYLTQTQVRQVIEEQDKRRAGGAKVGTFGEIALDMGLITSEQLKFAVQLQAKLAYTPGKPKPLGFFLLENGVVKPSQLHVALEEVAKKNRRLGEVLVEMGVVSEQMVDVFLKIQRAQT